MSRKPRQSDASESGRSRNSASLQQERMSMQALNHLGRQLLEKADPALLGQGTGTVVDFLSHIGQTQPRTAPAGAKIPDRRWQDRQIIDLIPAGSSVLDLGCGSGELLGQLIAERGVRAQGLELDPEAVCACVEKGVPVFQADLDLGLKGFPDNCFDYVILEETLQTLLRPAVVLAEMLRVGRHGIVSFPNFGCWRVRMDLLIRGRMPVSEWLPHHWYDTPNLHLFTLQDFIDWCDQEGVEIKDGYVLTDGTVRPVQIADNLAAEEALLVVEKNR